MRKRFEAAPKIVVGGIAYVDKVIAMMIVADAARYIESMTKTIASKRFVEGLWPANDPRRAFVEGAKWWEYTKYGATMWPSDRDLAEAEAEERAARGDWS